MLMLEPIIEATNLRELQTNLSTVAGHCWNATNCYYLTYHDRRQVLSFGNEIVIPEPTDQVVAQNPLNHRNQRSEVSKPPELVE